MSTEVFISDKTLLIISGGIEAIPGIQLALDMGLFVIVSDGSPGAPGLKLANDTIIASTYDWESTVEEAVKYHKNVRPIDGVMCIASDVPLTVAKVAKELGIPGIPVKSAELAMDKLAMKDCFGAAGVPIPWYNQVNSPEELIKISRKKEFSLIIKPADSRGARGVLRLKQDMDSAWAWNYAKSFSPTGRVMVEQYLNGPQLSTESMMLDGKLYTPGFSDRNYEFLEKYSPHIIENGGDLPSSLPQPVQDSIKYTVEKAALAMGIENGIVKGDMVVNNGQPYVIELAARLSGGYFCTHEIPLNTGVNLVESAIKFAIGDSINPQDLIPKYQKNVCQRYIFPEPGVVEKVGNADLVETDPNVAFLDIRVKPGDIIPEVENHPARAGVVICTGTSRENALENAKNAIKQLEIVTKK